MRSIRAAVALVMAISFLTLGSQVAQAIPTPTVVYNSFPSILPGNVPSEGFQATQTAELGDLVRLRRGRGWRIRSPR